MSGQSPSSGTLPPPPSPSGTGDAVGSGSQSCKNVATADLIVTVNDEGGEPLQGATVKISGPEARSGATAKNGKVEFRGVKPSPPAYSITASKPNYKNASTTATVPPGKKTRASLVLSANTKLTVKVEDAMSHKPIQGAEVRITPATGGTALQRQTDRGGSVVFTAINPDTYNIKVSHTNYKKPSEKKNVAVTEGAAKSETVALDPIGDITGTVRDKSSNAPIKGAKVSIKDQADIPVVTTGDNGTFKFEDLRAREYEVKARAVGYPDGAEKVTVRSNRRENVNIDLKPPQIKIKPKQKDYVVVVDAAGAATASYPVLEFDITDGPPGFLFEVQLGRDTKSFSGSPGLASSWDASLKPKVRRNNKLYSSWTSGQKTLTLDGTGKATFKAPLEWWKDHARLEMSKFDKADITYRVIAFPDAAAATKFASTADGSSAPDVKIKNNLVNFKVYKLRYHKDDTVVGKWRRFAQIEFKVREADTTTMYNMVQWKKGYRKFEDGTFPQVTDYGVRHATTYPTWQIDRLRTNPRYWDGTPKIAANKKTAFYTDDVSAGPPTGSHTRVDLMIDFISKMHVNSDIPAAVTIDAAASTTLPNGSPGVYRGIIDEDQAPILTEKPWSAKMQVSKDAGGNFKFKEL